MQVILAQGLGKQYRVGGGRRATTFRERISEVARSPLRRLASLGGRIEEEERFWALRDVSFAVREGEVVGIVGRNGAGKSTLLKVLSRITAPSTGRVELRGRVASLLEVGTGFHPELTGRENVFLSGAILGMTRAELRAKFDEIVAFAEVEDFLDTPVKRYSSGMAVRLAFAVAAHLEPEILVIDEVLAVGDQRFQARCLGKMDEVGRSGRTVLFVSHNLGAVARLCSRGLVLEGGCLVADDRVGPALQAYTDRLNEGAGLESAEFFGPLQDRLVFHRISINGDDRRAGVSVQPEDPIEIVLEGEARVPIEGYRTSVCVFREGSLLVTRHDSAEPVRLPAGSFRSTVALPSRFLAPGEYTVSFGGYSVESSEWTWLRDQVLFSVVQGWSPEYDTQAHMGMVNLPGFGRREIAQTVPPSEEEVSTCSSS